jgi:hypothetical protein
MLNRNPVQRFHRAIYLNLAAAGACLAYGAWPFFTEAPFIAALTAAVLLAAYLLEGRWSLSLGASNIVGGLVGAIIVAWSCYHFYRQDPAPIDSLPWPTSSLPYMALPFLLIVATLLLRPKKEPDYWTLLGCGVFSVTLACALSGDAIFGIPLLAYAITLIVALRRMQRVFLAGGRSLDNPSAECAMPSSHSDWLFWSAYAYPVIAAITLGAFLLTPRLTDAQWEIGHIGARLHTGVAERNPGVDLNLNGTLRTDDDIAFEVVVTDGGGHPKLDLSTLQRWRSAIFNSYDRGRWTYVPTAGYDRGFQGDRREGERRSRSTPSRPMRLEARLPNLGPDQYVFTFSGTSKGNYPPALADPVWPPISFPPRYTRASFGLLFSAGQSWPAVPLPPPRNLTQIAPIVSISDSGVLYPWAVSREGGFVAPTLPGNQQRPKFRQVMSPSSQADLSWPIELELTTIERMKMLPALSRLEEYADTMLAEMIVGEKISWRGNPRTDELPQQYHEQVARAICEHLATSGLYRYTLELTSKDKSIDPVEDFLLNVREGHCNRFSTALALLLRCHGIPTRLVLGFQGCEDAGEGRYVVRHNTAHSWVEAAIRRSTPAGPTWHWLRLDPSPVFGRADVDRSQIGRWIESVQRSTSDLFHNFVIDYNSDRQMATQKWLNNLNPVEFLHRIPLRLLFAIAVLVAIVFVGLLTAYSAARRAPSADPNAPRFIRFLDLARRKRLVTRNAATTPYEATDEFARAISDHPNSDALAQAARRLANTYCAERFGGTNGVDDTADFQLLFAALRDAPRQKA